MSEKSKEEILKDLFDKLPDVYDTFAVDISKWAAKHGFLDQLIEYMENTTDATTSSVLEKFTELLGIKKVYAGE